MGQLHKDRVAPAHRAESLLNLVACIESGTSFILALCLLFQIIVKCEGGGLIVAGGAVLILTSISPFAFYYMGNLWEKTGKLKNEKKDDWRCQNMLTGRQPEQQLLNPLGVSLCYDGSSLSAHPNNCRGAGDA